MKTVRGTRVSRLVTCLWRAAAIVLLGASAVSASTAYGIDHTGRRLVTFDTDRPGQSWFWDDDLFWLPAGQQMIDLDFRPKTSILYTLIGDGTTADLYRFTVKAFTGASLTRVSTTSIPFTGFSGAIDFDPVNDTLRVVSATGQSYRIDPETGTATVLTAVPGAPAGATIVGLAFSNNFHRPSQAVLYGLDVANSRLVTVGGGLNSDGGASGTITPIGPITPAIDGLPGFDIVANTGEAFVVLPGSDALHSALYRVDLATGATQLLGDIDRAGVSTDRRLKGLAVLSRASTIHAVNTANQLLSFLSAVPSDLRKVDGTAAVAQAITGMTGQVVALATRTSSGALYALTSAGEICTIVPDTAIATCAVTLPGGTLTGTEFGMSFEAAAPERLRVVSDNGQNLLIDADTGAVTPGPTLGNLVALAPGPSNTAWGIDATTDNLMTVDFTSAATPKSPLGVDTDGRASLDRAPADQTLFAVLTAPAASSSDLYVIPPGRPAQRVGPVPIPGGLPIRAMAVAARGRVRVNPTSYTVQERPFPPPGAPAPIHLERVAGFDGPLTVLIRPIGGDVNTIPDVDFVATETTFTVLPDFGAPTAMDVPATFIIDDQLTEPDEPFHLELYPISFVEGGRTAPQEFIITILDDDTAKNPTLQITSPTSAATYVANSAFIALAGVAADPDGGIRRVTWSTNHGASGTAFSTGTPMPNTTVEWFAPAIPLAVGQTVITVTAEDNELPARTVTKTLTVTMNELTYLMAEGATGFFNLDIAIANPSGTAADVEVEFFDEHGAVPGVQTFQLPAHARRTLTVNDLPGMDGRSVSTIVRSKNVVPLLVERTMEWDRATRYASATDHAVDGAARRWFFAEGAQGAFNTYLLLVNPNAGANVARVRYLRDNDAVVTVDYPLVGFQRFTVDIGNTTDFPAHAGLQQRVFGIEVTFDQPGVAERAMYFGYPPLWRGGHESAGVNLPSREWFLAEGATGFFQTYVLLANPSTQDALVDVDYLLPGGQLIQSPTPISLKAGQRTSIDVAGADPRLAATAVSTRISSTAPIVVERAQYWPSGAFENWQEAHNSFGITEPGRAWGLAEGRVGGDRGYATYILLANPGSVPATGTIRFLRENGTPLTKEFSVPAFGRFTVFGEDLAVPELVNESFGAVITSDNPIVVERAMYSNALGVTWQAGSNATATRLPSVP